MSGLNEWVLLNTWDNEAPSESTSMVLDTDIYDETNIKYFVLDGEDISTASELDKGANGVSDAKGDILIDITGMGLLVGARVGARAEIPGTMVSTIGTAI